MRLGARIRFMGSSYSQSISYCQARCSGGIDARGTPQSRPGYCSGEGQIEKTVLERLRPLSHRYVCGVVIHGTASSVDLGKIVSPQGEGVAAERMHVCGVGAALNQFPARPCQVDSFSTLNFFHDAKFDCLTFFSALLDVLGLFLVIPV